MSSIIYAPVKTGNVMIHDREVELVDRLAAAIAQSGFRADRVDVANFYVALKRRPMVILAGPARNGKVALVECLANLLAGGNGLQRQVVPGHAWYAGGSPVNTVLIGMHARMITEKLLFIIEEASQPENAQQVFVVGLTRISPAEMLSFFTEVAYQIQHNQIMRIGDAHLSTPVPFPPNLFLIGTMDTTDFDWWDEDLLSGATVIEWRANLVAPQAEAVSESQNLACELLRSSIRNTRRAYEKLLSVVVGSGQPLQTIMAVRGILQAHGLEFSPALLDEVILYLANAWSRERNGLFDPSTSRNLAIASDLALAQLVLPHNFKTIRSSESLQEKLYSVLDERLPRSCAFLKRQCERHSFLISPKGI